MGLYYPSPFKKKPAKYKLVGEDADTWVRTKALFYCPMWNSKIADPSLCNERKNIVKADQSRFSVGDSHNFTTMHTCDTCSGPVPISEMENVKQKTEQNKKILWLQAYLTDEEKKDIKIMADIPEFVEKVEKKQHLKKKPPRPVVAIGEIKTCSKCGNEFEAYQRGRMVIHKICRDCMGFHAASQKKVKALKEVVTHMHDVVQEDKKALVETLKDVVMPVPEMLQETYPPSAVPDMNVPWDTKSLGENIVNTKDELAEKLDAIRKAYEPVFEAAMKEDEEFTKEEMKRQIQAAYVPPTWEEGLFIGEEVLLEKLRQEAKSQRRDLKQHILFLLEQQVRY